MLRSICLLLSFISFLRHIALIWKNLSPMKNIPMEIQVMKFCLIIHLPFWTTQLSIEWMKMDMEWAESGLPSHPCIIQESWECIQEEIMVQQTDRTFSDNKRAGDGFSALHAFCTDTRVTCVQYTPCPIHMLIHTANNYILFTIFKKINLIVNGN